MNNNNDNTTLIDKSGTINIPEIWITEFREYSDGFLTIEKNDKYNWANKDGKLLSPELWFDWCNEFNDGCALYIVDGKNKYISTKGNLFDTKEEAKIDSNNEK